MIVMLEKGCGGRGKAVAAMMVSTALHRCELLEQRSPPGIERMQGATQAQMYQVF
ncbi:MULTISPECIES: hypothetical protein [unclassified Mesorhizobium]|uniref:hypothetical protein n=1 Tax=unclassified Mesorhizobium TaxID=325217 RepID=UPI0033390A09